MFTGIVEEVAKVKEIRSEGSNKRFVIKSEFASELEVDQSVAHNGVCLTVESIKANQYEVVAVKETLQKTNLASLEESDPVNLERCMRLNDRLDGHIVQGHVDGIAILDSISKEEGSWLFRFKLSEPSRLIVEKGSICVNGVSLTAFNVNDDFFSVAIIPYTYHHTNFSSLKDGSRVNLEFDIIGKYVARLNQS